MASARFSLKGFTLIELMITLAVIIVLLMLAVPSFIALRQRQTLNSVGEQVVGIWNQSRLEAAKRNQMVKVGYYVSGSSYCIGAATTADPADATPCDCTSAGACNVASFPARQSEWFGVTVVGTPTLGGNTGVAVIEPKRTTLTEPGDAGAVSMQAPPGQYSYRLNFLADGMGRGNLCESNAASHKMPAYIDRRCDP
jgi:prepilin-type N-terminal cleavage/methylation domain-containing protein